MFYYPSEETQVPPTSYEVRKAANKSWKIGPSATKPLAIIGLMKGASFKMETLRIGGKGDVVSRWKEQGAEKVLDRQDVKELTNCLRPTRRRGGGHIGYLTSGNWSYIHGLV